MERPYKSLDVWNLSMELVVDVFRATRNFPRKEFFGLVQQIQRSAVSIPSNIAEGYGRQNLREFRQFLKIARGSLDELYTQLEIARRLGYLKDDEFKLLDEKMDRVCRMLTGLIKHQNQKLEQKGG